ncbi:MAG: hypothetical protein NTZ59_08550 [Bacteroidetes bacterium]|jgi:hypothetical protein|nr:hypothetical protein [Bacteroidota bacterium]
MLRKATTILFLTAYLFATTEFCQLFKLPALINHYVEHKQENKDLSIWQFLCIHYASGDVKDADYDKDMKLPFKTHENCSVQILCIATPSSLSFNIKPVYIETVSNLFIPQDLEFSSLSLSNIWQPPKFS